MLCFLWVFLFFSFFLVFLFLFVSLLCLLQLMCNCRWLWAVACGSEWVRGWVWARGSMGLTESCKDTRRLTNDTHRTSNTHTSTRAAYDTLKCIFFVVVFLLILLCCYTLLVGVEAWHVEGNPPTQVLFYFFIFLLYFFLYFFFFPYLANFWRFTFLHVICFILFDGLTLPTPSVFMFPSLRYVFLRHFTFVSTFALAFLRLLCLLWSLNCPAMYAKVSRLRFLWLSLWVEKKLKCCSFDATFWPNFLYIFSQFPASDGQAAYISASNLPVS